MHSFNTGVCRDHGHEVTAHFTLQASVAVKDGGLDTGRGPPIASIQTFRTSCSNTRLYMGSVCMAIFHRIAQSLAHLRSSLCRSTQVMITGMFSPDPSGCPKSEIVFHRHVYGIRHIHGSDPSHTTSSPNTASARSSSSRSSPRLDPRPGLRHHWSSVSEADSEVSSTRLDPETLWMPVIGRISSHSVRLEREFNYNKLIQKSWDPDCKHTVRPVDMFRLPTTQGDKSTLLVAVYESPGKNYLRELVSFGPAFYGLQTRQNNSTSSAGEQIAVHTFLDFAIGACECLELLHHGAKAVHGEIRADAFHFNRAQNVVRLANTGNGPRSFENLLSSEGWSTLNKELGVKNKLQVRYASFDVQVRLADRRSLLRRSRRGDWHQIPTAEPTFTASAFFSGSC